MQAVTARRYSARWPDRRTGMAMLNLNGKDMNVDAGPALSGELA